jgi:hypothetical protein
MYTTAEVGVALAGFAALVISFRQREGSPLTDLDRLVTANLVERGLMAALFSFLPILLFGLELSPRIVWFVSSGAFAVYGVSAVTRSLRSRRLSGGLVAPIGFYTLIGVALLIVALQVCHALELGLRQSAWWYLVALTWLLVSAGYRFFFILRQWVRTTSDT